MHGIVLATASAVWRRSGLIETLPDPLPRPPGHPPGEPIIIKKPPRPAEVPEIDGPPDKEHDPEIKKPPEIAPEQPPPPAPWDRADHPSAGASAGAYRLGWR
jgi:hypothetical protein